MLFQKHIQHLSNASSASFRFDRMESTSFFQVPSNHTWSYSLVLPSLISHFSLTTAHLIDIYFLLSQCSASNFFWLYLEYVFQYFSDRWTVFMTFPREVPCQRFIQNAGSEYLRLLLGEKSIILLKSSFHNKTSGGQKYFGTRIV